MDVESLPLPVFGDARGVSVELHAHIRGLIFANSLPAGTVLKQAELARAFGVSRTPMREAFRMLQEEGLIEAEMNQRARVRGLDPSELDQLYGVRITLESLGTRLTAGRIETSEIEAAYAALGSMHAARGRGDSTSWARAHRRFHGLCMARADEPLRRIVASYASRSERYLRMDQILNPDSFAVAHNEHRAILDAVIAGDGDLAGTCMARHLARTATNVLREAFPGAGNRAIAAALALTHAGVLEG